MSLKERYFFIDNGDQFKAVKEGGLWFLYNKKTSEKWLMPFSSFKSAYLFVEFIRNSVISE